MGQKATPAVVKFGRGFSAVGQPRSEVRGDAEGRRVVELFGGGDLSASKLFSNRWIPQVEAGRRRGMTPKSRVVPHQRHGAAQLGAVSLQADARLPAKRYLLPCSGDLWSVRFGPF